MMRQSVMSKPKSARELTTIDEALEHRLVEWSLIEYSVMERSVIERFIVQ